MATSACSASAMAVLATGGIAQAEPARIEAVRDSYHGETVVDPYRWMEAGGEPLTNWLKSQDAQARAALDGPERQRDLKLIGDYSAANVSASGPRFGGPYVFYLKRPQGAGMAKLYVRPRAGGEERVLVDPEARATGSAPVAIQTVSPSPDGRFVALTLAQGGSEEATLHVLETATGRMLPEIIDRARFAHPEWDPERAEFYYARLRVSPPGAPAADRFKDQTIYRHRVGDSAANDVAVFSPAEHKAATGRDSMTDLILPGTGDWALAITNSGVSMTGEFYATRLSDLRAGHPAWRKVIADADQVLQVSAMTEEIMRPALIGSTLYVASLKDAPRGRVVELDLSATSGLQPVLDEQEGVLTGFAPAADGVYLIHALGGRYGLSRLDPASGVQVKVPTPYDGAIYQLETDVHTPGAVYSLESWSRPRTFFLSQHGASHDLGLSPAFPFPLTDVVAEEITVAARDGVGVPVSIVRRAGPRDPSARAIVEAYGAYAISVDPYFDARWMPWIKAGGVLVQVHARGGGEFGEAWHLAGQKDTKPNTWRDLIDAAEAIAAQGIAARDGLVALGTSAGGIAVGRALTERPDLWAGVIANVPMSDALRFELTEGGPANVAEFGTVQTLEGYRALKMMSPYAHVEDGVAYPSVLLTGGLNDHRVPIWQPAKLAARLQAANKGGKPVFLRVDWDAGHGVGSSKAQRDELYADFYAFSRKAADDAPARARRGGRVGSADTLP